MIFFGVPSVGQVKPDTLFGTDDHYGFIQTLIGEEYNPSEINDKCSSYYQKGNVGYWGRIITLINFLALKKLDSNNRFLNIPLLDYIGEDYDKNNGLSSEILFDYLLAQWQYPHPILTRNSSIQLNDINIENPRTDLPIIKPYVIILAILNQLFFKNPMNSYLTREEFYWLGYEYYKKKGKGIDLKNVKHLAAQILNIRKSGWDYYQSIKNKAKTKTHLSYPLGFLRNSSVLTTNSQDYHNPTDFFIGIKPSLAVTTTINSIISASQDYFDFPRTLKNNDKILNYQYSEYLYNNSRIKYWLGQVRLYNGINNIFDKVEENNPEDFKKSKSKKVEIQLKRLENLDKYSQSKRRTEQYILREYLLGDKENGSCAICNNDYPTEFLATAHIKKRSECTDREKKDINIVMPACHFGCDKIYEEGYIYIQDGKIFESPKKKKTTESLNKYVSEIIGRDCNYFKETTKKYFEHHAKQNI